VELVFVIDEQAVLSQAGYLNVLAFVANLTNTFTTTSSRTRFGVWFTATSNTTSPPLLLTQNTAPPNLVTNVILPHLHANSSSTNFVASVVAAINKFWPTGGPASGVAREVLTILGGPDASNGDYSPVQNLLATQNIQAWALGVETGASQSAAMAGLSTQGSTYQHFEGIWDSTVLGLNVGNEGQLLCPQASLCGSNCKGFCSCSAPGVNTCSCPTCVNPTCQIGSCTNVAVGCVSQPKNCDDHNGECVLLLFAFLFSPPQPARLIPATRPREIAPTLPCRQMLPAPHACLASGAFRREPLATVPRLVPQMPALP
jgi:hypothetical protein